MSTINVSLEVLARVLGTQPGAISEALKTDDEWKPQGEIDSHFNTAFANRFKAIKKEGHQEGHGRGLKESLSKKESEIKAKYSVEGATMDELFENALEAERSKFQDKGLEDVDIKKSKLFQDTVADFRTKLASKDQEITVIRENATKKEIGRALRTEANKVLKDKELNFMMSEDPGMFETWMELYLTKVQNGNKFKLSESGQAIAVDGDGEALKDDHYNVVSIRDLLVQNAKTMFPQAQGKPRTGPNVGTSGANAGAGGNGEYTFPNIQNREQAMAHMQTLRDAKEIDAFETHVLDLDKQGRLAEVS